MWYRLDDPPMDADGILDPLALIVCADTMPGAVAEIVGPDRRRGWFGPSVDLTVHLLDSCRSEWVLAHNRARYAGDGYASLDMALWDHGDDGTGDGRLVAYATQICFFAFGGVSPGPSGRTGTYRAVPDRARRVSPGSRRSGPARCAWPATTARDRRPGAVRRRPPRVGKDQEALVGHGLDHRSATTSGSSIPSRPAVETVASREPRSSAPVMAVQTP